METHEEVMPRRRNKTEKALPDDFEHYYQAYKNLSHSQKTWLAKRPFFQTDVACCEAIGISTPLPVFWRKHNGFRELEAYFLDDPSRIALAERDTLLLLAQQACAEILQDKEASASQRVSAMKWALDFRRDTEGLQKQHKPKIVKMSPKMGSDGD